MKSRVRWVSAVCLISCLVWVAAGSALAQVAQSQPARQDAAAAVLPAPSAVDVATKVLPTLALENATLVQALGAIAQQSGARLAVDWQGLARVGATAESKVTAAGEKVPVARALDMVLAGVKDIKAPLGWTIYSNVFLITSQMQIMNLRRFSDAMRTVGHVENAAGSPRPGAASAPSAQQQAATQERITGHMDFQYEQVPLEDVISSLRTRTGLNIVVNWHALERTGVEKTSPVTLNVSGVPLAQGLDLIFMTFNGNKTPLERVYWEMRDNVLSITTGAVLDTQMETRIYDVADLLLVVPDFAPQSTLGNNTAGANTTGNTGTTGINTGMNANSSGMSNSPGRSGGYSSGSYGSTPSQSPSPNSGLGTGQGGMTSPTAGPEDALVTTVQNMIGPEYWQPAGKGTVRIFKGKMIINQSRLGFMLLDRGL